jgi:hypothetical protein
MRNILVHRRLFLSGIVAGLLGAMLVLTPAAFAHRFPMTVTTVEKTADGTLNITHRMHAHDAVRVLALDPEVKQPELESLRNRAKVALYVSENFLLSDNKLDDGSYQPMEKTVLGAEVEGDYLFVYEEATPATGKTLFFKSTILQVLGDGWLAHVNDATSFTVKSTAFNGEEIKWSKGA